MGWKDDPVVGAQQTDPELLDAIEAAKKTPWMSQPIKPSKYNLGETRSPLEILQAEAAGENTSQANPGGYESDGGLGLKKVSSNSPWNADPVMDTTKKKAGNPWENDPLASSSEEEAPPSILAIPQGIANSVGSIGFAGLAGTGGIVNKASELLGGNPGIADPLIEAGASFDKSAKSLVLSPEEQAKQGIGSKFLSGAAGAIPYLMAGPAAPALMAATGTMDTGKTVLEGGGTVGQAVGAGLTGGVAGGVVGMVPGLSVTPLGSAAKTAAINVATGTLSDAFIQNVVLDKEAQPDLAKNFNPFDLEKRALELGTGGAFGAGAKLYHGAMEKRSIEQATARIKELSGTMDKIMSEQFPTADATPLLLPGETHKDAIGRLISDPNMAKTKDLLALIKEDPTAHPWERELAAALHAVSDQTGHRDVPFGIDPSNVSTGLYYPAADVGVMPGIKYTDHYLLLHEIVHGATVGALEWRLQNPAITPDMSSMQQNIWRRTSNILDLYDRAGNAAVSKLATESPTWVWKDRQGNERTGHSTFDDIKEHLESILDQTQVNKKVTPEENNFFEKYYGLLDSREFASEALTSKKFREFLSSENIDPKDLGKFQMKSFKELPNLWTAFKQTIKDLIGKSGGALHTSLLEASIDNIMGIAGEQGPAMRAYSRELKPIDKFAPDMVRKANEQENAYRKEHWQGEADKAQVRAEGERKALDNSGVTSYMLQRIAFLRKQAQSKAEFLNRLRDEVPDFTKDNPDTPWGDFVEKWGNTLWENPNHLNTVAGSREKLSGAMSRWARTPSDVDEFVKNTLPDFIDPDTGQVKKQMAAYMDLNDSGTNVLNSQNLRLLKSDTLAGKVLKYVHDRVSEYRTIKAINLARATYHFGKFNEMAKGERFALLDLISNWQSKSDLLKQIGERYLTDDILRSEGMSDKQIEAYKGLAKGTDYLWSLIDQARVKMGRDPLPFQPGYMPHVFDGAYKVMVKATDKKLAAQGIIQEKVVKVVGFQTRRGAENYIKSLKAGAEDSTTHSFSPDINPSTNLPYRVLRFENITHSLASSIHEHLDAYENMLLLDPATQNILQNIETNSMRGMTKHMLERSDVDGWIGQDGSGWGKKVQNLVGMTNNKQEKYLKLYENYAKSVSEFYGNVLFMDEVMSPLLDVVPPAGSQRNFYGAIFAENPKLVDSLKKFAYNFTGENLNELKWFDDRIQEALIKGPGVDPLLAKKAVRSLKNALSMMALKVNPGNWGANVFQPIGGIGILTLFNSNVAKEGIKAPSIMKSIVEGVKAFNDPQSDHLEALQWVTSTHQADASLNHELTNSSTMDRTVGSIPGVKTLWNMNQSVEEFGRKLTFMIAYEHMKEVYKDPTVAREVAANVMEMTMVNYDRSERPLMYQNFGLAGEFVSPFSVFKNAALGNTWMAMKFAAQNPKDINGWKPLAVMMLSYVPIAGALGTIGVSEWDWISRQFNRLFPESPMTTPSDYFASHGWANWASYGVISSGLGVNISTSMNAVGLDDMFTAALVPFVTDIAKLGAHAGQSAFARVGVGHGPSVQDVQGPLHEMAPALLKPWVDQYATGTNNMTLKPKATTPEGMVIRSPMDQKVAQWTGKESVYVANKMALAASDAQNQRNIIAAAKDLVSIGSDWVRGRTNPTSYDDAAYRWSKLTGRGYDEFNNAVKQSLEGQRTTYLERLTNKPDDMSSSMRVEEIIRKMEGRR